MFFCLSDYKQGKKEILLPTLAPVTRHLSPEEATATEAYVRSKDQIRCSHKHLCVSLPDLLSSSTCVCTHMLSCTFLAIIQ